MDATVFDVDSELKADIVLADVPCSGLRSDRQETGDQVQGYAAETGRDCDPSENRSWTVRQNM